MLPARMNIIRTMKRNVSVTAFLQKKRTQVIQSCLPGIFFW